MTPCQTPPVADVAPVRVMTLRDTAFLGPRGTRPGWHVSAQPYFYDSSASACRTFAR